MKEQLLERIKELVSQRGGSTYDLCDHQDENDLWDNGIPISGFGAGRKLVGYAISVEDNVWCIHVVDLNDDEEEMIELKNLDQVALKMIQNKIEQFERRNEVADQLVWTLEDQAPQRSWFVHRVIGLTEPTLEGPFADDNEALEGAKVNFDRDDCTFGLIVDWEKREVQTYAFDYDEIESEEAAWERHIEQDERLFYKDQLRQEDEQE